MTKQDRMWAFSLRCDGLTWAEIADRMGYSTVTVYEDINRVIDHPPKPKIIYDQIRYLINAYYGGSINRFAEKIRVSPSRLRRVLIYGDKPTPAMKAKISEGLGRRTEELFP